MSLANMKYRLLSVLIAGSVLCLSLAAIYVLMILYDSFMDTPYDFQINGSEKIIVNMAVLETYIKKGFPEPVTVEIFRNDALLEAFTVNQHDLLAPLQPDYEKSLERGDVYSRLKMYAEPGKLDLFFRKVWVDKSTFSTFADDLILLNFERLKDSAKPVFLR